MLVKLVFLLIELLLFYFYISIKYIIELTINWGVERQKMWSRFLFGKERIKFLHLIFTQTFRKQRSHCVVVLVESMA